MPPKRTVKLSRPASPASIGGDTESVISEISDLADSLSITDSAAILETALTKLLDRRASTRLESLEIFNRLLSLQLHSDFLETEQDAIRSGLISSLKRNIPEETIECCRFIEIITITMGSRADRLLNEAIPILKSLSRHGEKIQPAAVRALSIIQLITCHHTDALHHWMATFSRFFRRRDPALASAAIDAWALLASQLSNSDLAGPSRELYLPRLAVLLHSQSVDVRTSAGEALALLFEAIWQREKDADSDDAASDHDGSETEEEQLSDEEDDDESDQVTPTENDSSLESDEEVDVDELQDVLAQLATDGTRSRARKERSLQRSVFRSVDATVRSGELPRVTLKIGKERLTFGTWKSIIRLSAMREVLAQGFFRHISSNELVRNMLLIPNESQDAFGDLQAHPDSVSVQAKDVSSAKTKLRQQKKKAERSSKHSFRFDTD